MNPLPAWRRWRSSRWRVCAACGDPIRPGQHFASDRGVAFHVDADECRYLRGESSTRELLADSAEEQAAELRASYDAARSAYTSDGVRPTLWWYDPREVEVWPPVADHGWARPCGPEDGPDADCDDVLAEYLADPEFAAAYDRAQRVAEWKRVAELERWYSPEVQAVADREVVDAFLAAYA